MEQDYLEGSVSDEWRMAIREVGQASIPTLLSLLEAKDSPLKRTILALAKRQTIIRLNFISAETKQQAACDAFSMLGASASNAVPELIRIYDRNVSLCSRKAIINALYSIGPGACEAVPALLGWTGSTNEEIRETALVTLTRIHSPPEKIISILVKCMHDPSAPCRATAAGQLKAFGKEAQSAIPELVRALKDPNEQVRNAAAVTLQVIDSDTPVMHGINTTH